MSGPVKRTLAALMIVLALSACDNVEWGGVQVEVVTPGSAADTTAAGEPVAPAQPEGPVLPEGPTLFMASMSGDGSISVRPVAEIATDSLIPLPLDRDMPGFSELFARERMGPGTALTLFAEGARVGTARIDSVDFQPGRCSPTPVGLGVAEVVPAAAAVTRFVALPEGAGRPLEHQPFVPREHSYDQRVAGLELAADAISRSGAPWPGSVLETRADMQALPLDGDRSGAIAATFLFQDALRVGPPLTRAAWGIFVLGTGGPTDYRLAHMEYRPVDTEKAAIRFYEQADWDADGQTEILLEAFGEESRWALALDRRNGRWLRIFEERCDPVDAGS